MKKSLITLILAINFLLFFLSSQAAFGSVDPLRQWTLRFANPTSYKVATVGCYGTSSYSYRLPNVEYAQAYQIKLKEVAAENSLSGFIFTSEKEGSRPIIMDLATGELDTISPVFNANQKGVAFCICSRNNTHLKNCSPSRLGPLGTPFTAKLDNGNSENGVWTDPVTENKWIFAAVAKNWRDAHAVCEDEGYMLPDHPTLAHVAKRIYNSFIGELIVKADSRVVWSSEEFDWDKAMFVYIPRGSAAAGNKRHLYPVLCYKP
jgi:hypothetical protein